MKSGHTKLPGSYFRVLSADARFAEDAKLIDEISLSPLKLEATSK